MLTFWFEAFSHRIAPLIEPHSQKLFAASNSGGQKWFHINFNKWICGISWTWEPCNLFCNSWNLYTAPLLAFRALDSLPSLTVSKPQISSDRPENFFVPLLIVPLSTLLIFLKSRKWHPNLVTMVAHFVGSLSYRSRPFLLSTHPLLYSHECTNRAKGSWSRQGASFADVFLRSCPTARRDARLRALNY